MKDEIKDELKYQKKLQKEQKKHTEGLQKHENEIINGPIKKEKKDRHRKQNEPPVRTTLEEIGNSVTHGVGALWALSALIMMLLKSDTPLKITASLVYGFSMIFLMTMSCLYHAFKTGSKVKRIWRRFDYCSIYLLIGGTFAPLFLVDWGNKLGIILFVIQWMLIITGITLVSIFGPGRLKWIHFPLYFLIGWSGIIFIPGWIEHNLSLLWWILIGGVIYTLGMIPFVMNKVKSAHFIWHFFVLLGAVAQWIGIYFFVY